MKKAALAVLVALIATPAMAQTESAPAAAVSQCGDMPAAPTIPDGATADRAAMDAANAAYNAWGAQAQAVLSCRRAEAQEARARSDALVGQYNAAAEQVRTTSEQMVAAAAAFNAR